MFSTRIPRRWLALAALLYVSPASAAITVDLVLNDSDPANPKLEIIQNSAQCAGQGKDCIEVAKFSKPNIRFILEDACDSDGPPYKLDSLRIGMVEKDWPSSTQPLPTVVAQDFKADPDTGLVDFAAGNNNKANHRLKFKNKNSRAYTVFYEITAKHCTDPLQPDAKLDPRIRNTGGKF